MSARAQGVVAVVTPFGGRFDLGGEQGIVRFEEYSVPGQMALVPWVRGYRADGSCIEFNAALAERIERAAPGRLA